MPWTKKDFPNSLKNLEEEVRLKAIDIGNAMMKDGYDEQRVIPIAISKAKDWYKEASPKEKKDLKKKDITKHKKTSSNSAEFQDSDIIVKYRDQDKKWEVKSKGAEKPDSLHDKKVDAEKRAREISKYRDGKVISYKKNKN
ncbi:MAG: DUF2188 domain-containing protein [Anaerococcus sp.]